jgi:hypothetical protein
MKDLSSLAEIPAIKDDLKERPIPTAWRPVFRSIVSAFVQGDYLLETGVVGVEAVSMEGAVKIENYVKGYGATLIELPDDTWDSSVCIWSGSHWDALVDLWTEAEGRSDLVLSARVVEADTGFLFKIYMVYVP